MSEIKRRIKKDLPQAETEATPPRRARVTLTKDVSSPYRKLVPRAQAGGSAKPRPPRPKSPAVRSERGGSPKQGPRRLDNPGPGGGLSRTLKSMKDLIDRELPGAVRQLREAQNLLQTTAEEMLTILEEWENRPPEEAKDSQALVNILFEKMSFQDLAGQRLAKVYNFLRALDGSGQPGDSADHRPPSQAGPLLKTSQAGGPETRPGQDQPEKNLKGPQMPESRLAQNEVDQILMALLLR